MCSTAFILIDAECIDALKHAVYTIQFTIARHRCTIKVFLRQASSWILSPQTISFSSNVSYLEIGTHYTLAILHNFRFNCSRIHCNWQHAIIRSAVKHINTTFLRKIHNSQQSRVEAGLFLLCLNSLSLLNCMNLSFIFAASVYNVQNSVSALVLSPQRIALALFTTIFVNNDLHNMFCLLFFFFSFFPPSASQSSWIVNSNYFFLFLFVLPLMLRLQILQYFLFFLQVILFCGYVNFTIPRCVYCSDWEKEKTESTNNFIFVHFRIRTAATMFVHTYSHRRSSV